MFVIVHIGRNNPSVNQNFTLGKKDKVKH